MRGELLWVYEGLTTYLEWVITARCGLQTVEESLDGLAEQAAVLDQRPGRTWRSLRDTAIGAQLVFEAPAAGSEWRRGADFYDEGALVWLEADVLIRQQTKGTRSLDDFCKRFFAGPGGTPRVVPYTYDDVIATLQATMPYDWRGFFAQRLDSKSPHAPLGGVTAAGWQLVYADTLSAAQRLLEQARKSADLRHSIGVRLDDHGRVRDIVPGGAAARAGVTPGMSVVAVDGRAWSANRMRDTIRGSRQRSTPIDLLVQDGDFYRTYQLDYRGGERAPRLQRDAARADLLAEILAPRAPEPGSPH
jgi:predicted metalloprotease with PDZ domain